MQMPSFIKSVSLSWIAIFIIGYFVIDRHLQYELWDKEDGVIVSDAKAYYGYLPAFFIEKDISLAFVDEHPEKAGLYWFNTFDERNVIKMTCGLSMLSLPFFGIPLAIFEDVSGFEPPFKMALIASSLFYLFLGFIFLRKLLLEYFVEGVAALTLVLIGLGTNLWYYSIEEVFMSHVFSFSLISVFLFHSLKKRASYSGLQWWVVFGVLIGFISLIRPTNVLVLLIPVLYKRRVLIKTCIEEWKNIMLAILTAILVWFPQLLYWKTQAGAWFFFSYGDEGFDFLSPHIWEGLFGFRKGFFIYTPVMLLIIPGLYLVKKKYNELFVPSLIFLVLNVFVIFSWWCWWYGGSFGSRPMIDTYALNALFIAASIEAALRAKLWVSIPVFLLMLGGVHLNRYQTQQYRWKVIHWDAMTKEAYFFTLLNDPEAPEVEPYLDKPEY